MRGVRTTSDVNWRGRLWQDRLALEVAGSWSRTSRRRLVVELASLSQPQQVAGAVARTWISARRQVGNSGGDAGAGPARRLLVVLDNCEHLADGLRTFGAAPATACPNLRVLATSRHACASMVNWSGRCRCCHCHRRPCLFRYAPVAMRMRSKSLLHGHAPLGLASSWMRKPADGGTDLQAAGRYCPGP